MRGHRAGGEGGLMVPEDPDYAVYEAPVFALQCGITLPKAVLAYKTHGTLNAAKDNVIVFPSRYAGTHADQTYLIGDGMALDPAKYFIVCVNMMGSGLSSSPSNTPIPLHGPDFPAVTQYDNVRLQEQMLREVFGIEKIRLVCGWSMGGQQSFHWAAMFPDRVQAMACIAGQGTTVPHTHVFLEGVKQGILMDPAWEGGRYKEQPWRGLTAKGRIWAGWVLSHEWFRQKTWETMGYVSLEDYLKNVWDNIYYHRDANDMLSLIRTWQLSNIAANDLYGGDQKAAYGAITARSILMPSATDFYFPVADNEAEAAMMPNAEVRPIPSIWGHYAGGGRVPEDTAFIDAGLKDLLA
ncbi:MAG: alpha/beta fold hydrolase [Pseudomonadota bacterium]